MAQWPTTTNEPWCFVRLGGSGAVAEPLQIELARTARWLILADLQLSSEVPRRSGRVTVADYAEALRRLRARLTARS